MNARRLAALAAMLAVGCSELPTPPAISHAGRYLDTAGVLRDSLTGLYQDPQGIWRDEVYNLPFSDIPLAYRPFFRYCTGCHSNLATQELAGHALAALRLNTWDDILAYGPEKLLLAAKSGGMPLAPIPKVPEDVLGRAQAYLAHWNEGFMPVIIHGFKYADAENFIRKYCADCHTPGGTHPEQANAMRQMILDSYNQWHLREERIKTRIDTAADPLFIMPPDTLPPERKPTVAERRQFMEWIDRLSPNTPDGSGRGDSIVVKGIVTSGAMKGLVYDTAFKLINRYCADCHTLGGLNADQASAWNYAARLDDYQNWADYGLNLEERLDPLIAEAKSYEVMPRPSFPFQPTAGERQLLLDWIRRGSPNTVDGR